MSAYNSRITIESPFPRIDLPSLHCWQERIWSSIHNDEVPTELEKWMDWQLGRMDGELDNTWAIYKDGVIGGYAEARVDELGPPFWGDTACMALTFRRNLWGLSNTGPALRLVLHTLFTDDAIGLAIFPLFTINLPIKELVNSVGASNIGVIDSSLGRDTEMFMLPVAEWKRKNAAFISEYEAAHSVESLVETAKAMERFVTEAANG